MDKIRQIQDNIKEEEFKIRQLEDFLNSKLSSIKDNIPKYRNLGILDEEGERVIQELNLEHIRSSDLEEFKKIYLTIVTINQKIEEHIESLNKELSDLDKLYLEGVK